MIKHAALVLIVALAAASAAYSVEQISQAQASQPQVPQPQASGSQSPQVQTTQPSHAPLSAQRKKSIDQSETINMVEGFKRLQEGNSRFVEGKPRHPHEAAAWRTKLEEGQHPFAVVLGCSDSRVPPELVFDQGFGDLFVIRVAGNVVDTDVIASVEYAIDHLDTELIVVMGHSNCGAVSATVQHLADPEGEPAEVVSLLYQIEPAVTSIPEGLSEDERVAFAVRRNVELALRRLSRVPDLRRSIKAGKVRVVGAVYDMHTGKVNFID